jgi:hypothetical protein
MAGIDWLSLAFWTAFSTWVLAIGTLIALYWQMRQAQVLNSANAVIDLRDKFDSSRMRSVRRHISERLLKQAPEDIASLEVVTFFELIGTLTHRKVLDMELVWEAFGSWVTSYWWGLRHPVDWVGRLRQDLGDPLVFHEFEWLYVRIDQMDLRELAKVGAPPVDPGTEAHRILSREALLESV